MATTREDIRTEVRDNIQEASGIDGAIFNDTLLNRHILREVRSLPSKEIYIEYIWEQSLDADTDYSDGIALPSGTIKVEEVEKNDGTTTDPVWNPLLGVDNYAGKLFLPYTITTDTDIRVKLKKAFTDPTTDSALDVPDDKCEVIVWGVTVRCYRILIGYLRGSQSWDSVTKPGDLNINTVNSWLREAQEHYKELIRQYAFVPKPRDIDLTS